MQYGGEDEELEASTTRVMTIGAVLLVAFALIFPLYRFFEPSNRDDSRETHLQSLATEGENTWGFNCASCHGLSGQGGTAPALNSKEFLQAATDLQIEQFVSVGLPGTQMSAFSQDFAGPLTSAQIKAVATYIRSWEPDAPSNPDWRLGAPVEAAAGDTTETTVEE